MNSAFDGLRRRAIPLATATLAGVGVLAAALEWEALRGALGRSDWRPLLLALLFTLLSYACLSYSFAAINEIFGVRMSRRQLLELGFVSFALSNLLATGGAAGYSLRVLVARRRGTPVADVLAASLLHSSLNNLVLFFLVPAGLACVLANRALPAGLVAAVAAAALALLALTVAIASALLVAGVRSAVLRRVAGVSKRLFGRDLLGEKVGGWSSTLGPAAASVRERPGRLLLPAALVALDWTASMAALWCCFLAVGRPIGGGVLVAGFAIGVTAGLVSMVPGGLGVQDGSMAAVYALLGLPLGVAVLAAVLFRLVYYVVPFLFSLALYRRLLRGAPPSPSAGERTAP